MSKKGNGIRKIVSLVLVVAMLAVMFVCSALPVGAFELTAEMLQELQSFFEKEDAGLALDRDALTDFAQHYLNDMRDKDPVNFSDEMIAELESLLTDEEGQVDYGILVDLLEKRTDADHPITIQSVLDMLEKVETLEQVVSFVEVQQSYADGVAPKTYTVEWQLNGQTVVTQDGYRHMDAYLYPNNAELGLVSGEFVKWDTKAFFEAPADGAETVVVTGTVYNLAEEMANLANGVEIADQVFDAVIDEKNNTIVLALSVTPSNYLDVLSDLANYYDTASAKSEVKTFLYDFASLGINAGVNRISVNGHLILDVESYDLDKLVDLLGDLTEGDVEGLISIDGLKSFAKSEDISMSRFTELKPVTVNGVTYESFGTYAVTLDTDDHPTDTWNVSFAFKGDTSRLVQVAQWLESAVTVSDAEGGKSVLVDLTDEKMQLILEQAYESASVPESIKGLISRFEIADDEYIYVVNADMTVGELKDLIRNGDYDSLIKQLTGMDVSLNQREKFQKLLDKVLGQIDAKWDTYTLGDFYDGNNHFTADATREQSFFEKWANKVFGGYSYTLGGKEISSDVVLQKIFDRIDFQDVYVQVDVKISNYYLVYIQNGDAVEGVFAKPGTSLSDLFNAVEAKDGYDIVYLLNGEELTVTPEADVAKDAPITYEYRVREHDLTVNVELTDPVTGETETVSKELTVAYGSVLDEAYLSAVLAGLIPEGYDVTMPEATTMPDGDLTLTVKAERIYFTITWIVDGVTTETSVAWGEMPVFADPVKDDDLWYSYTFKGWTPAIVVAKANVTYTAEFSATFLYGEDLADRVVIGKTDGSITVSITGPNGEGMAEIVWPVGPILSGLKADKTLNLQYAHNFGGGYYMDLDVPAEEAQLILKQLDEILASMGLTYDNVTIRTSRKAVTVDGKTGYRYDVTFEVDGKAVAIDGLNLNTVSVNMDALTDPEMEYAVYYKDPVTGELVEIEYTVVGTDANGKLILEFTLPAFTEIYVMIEAIEYTVEILPTENGAVVIDPENAAAGETVTVTVTPNEGYVVGSIVYVDKDGVEHVIEGENNVYTYAQPSGGSKVKVIFELAKYVVIFKDYNGDILAEVEVEHGGDATPPADPSREATAEFTYYFAGWDSEDYLNVTADGIVITAMYDAERNQYVVTFKDYDDTVLYELSYYYGDVIVAPASPVRANTVLYSYAFAGWTPAFEVVTGDATYTATYTETENYPSDGRVSVTLGENGWNVYVDYSDGNGTGSATSNFAPFLDAIRNGLNVPINYRHDFGDNYYLEVVFAPESYDALLAALGDAEGDVMIRTSRAVTEYNGMKAYQYEISLLLGDEVVPVTGMANNVQQVNVATSADTALVVYALADDGSVEALDGKTLDKDAYGRDKFEFNTPHYSTFIVVEEPIPYAVEIAPTENGTVEADKTTAIVGETVTVTVTPAVGYEIDTIVYVDADGNEIAINGSNNVYTYQQISGGSTVQVTFKLTKHTVTFLDWNGTVLKTETLDYGTAIVAPADPTRAATAQYTYVFAGWDKEVAATVTEDVEYTATYTETVNKYTVTFVDWNGTVLKTETLDYGTAIVAPADPTRAATAQYTYTFAGWDKEVAATLTENVEYTATYTETVNKYEVIFVDWDGTVLKTETVEYGAAATAPADPTRAADDSNTYTFAGWDTDAYKNVTEKVTVTATYTATPIELDTETSEPETKPIEPETNEPDTETSEPETKPVEPETNESTDTTPVVPGTNEGTDTDGDDDGGCSSSTWWIILLIVVVLIILALIGFILYQKGVFAKHAEEEEEETEEPVEEETVEDAAPLFIPLGEELPEEEPEEIHIVHEVSVEEVDELMSDATAEHVLEESVKIGGTGKLGIINIGELHDVFSDGDTVTLEILQEKSMVDDNIGRLKVLASGSLDKALTVEADAFSVQAIKMITLTGGRAVKLRNAGDVKAEDADEAADAETAEAPEEKED